MVIAAATSPLWFITRATGITALILLTITVALGVANVSRVRTPRMPRFVIDSVHRSASLLAVTFLVAHILTTVLDGYVPISLLDAVVPFGASYRTFWLGLGAVSCDLLIAVTVTSLLRRRLGYKAWRATHWLAYASWPVAVLHGLGTGSDAHTGWMVAITLTCTAVVLAAVLVRLAGASASDAELDAGPGSGSVAARTRPPARRPALSGGPR